MGDRLAESEPTDRRERQADAREAAADRREQDDDIREGVLDGWDAAYRVRADKSLRDIPILVVSAITSSDYLSMLPTDDDNMIDGFISKPVQPQAFANEVTRLLSR